jgi:ribonuclease J
MQLLIHRGSKEIGGTCVELRSGDSRIILDVGMPLVKPDGAEFNIRDYDGLTGEALLDQKVLPQVDGLYRWQKPSIDGVLISHAHQDHYGFLDHIHPDIPVYLSAGTQKLIEITALFTGKKIVLNNTLCFSWPSRFAIGTFTITPHLVDHSSFSAFGFEIEADGERIFYSGDFREHGYLGKAMDTLYRKVAPNVDALLMEGSILGREDERVQTEGELSQEATTLCENTNKAVLIFQSGQNISRAVSFYKAAKRNKRYFVPDVYTAHVLSELSHCPGGQSLPRPGYPGFKDIRVWYPHNLTSLLFNTDRKDIPLRYQPHKITKNEIAENLRKVMLFVRPGMQKDLRLIQGIEGSTLIYSLWEGYRAKEKTRQFIQDIQSLGIKVQSLHTSGHADLHELRRMVSAMQPKQIIPIHTFHPNQYPKLFDAPVLMVREGEETPI